MKYEIHHAPVFSTLHVTLEAGEQIKAEAGAMVAMSSSIELQAKTTGKGFFGTLGAALGGESIFASLFTAQEDGSELILAPSYPGDILVVELEGNGLFAQGGAWLASSPDIELQTKGSMKAFFSGEGLFLQYLHGRGTVFFSSYGAIIKKILKAGESYKVDSGHIVAFEESIQYKIRTASRGLMSSMISGEGLVCEYYGPGTIWIQSRNLPSLAKVLEPYLPKPATNS
ncbi:MAG: TIGR00266 family protein [Treponemataceae bacterium]|nr:TIGR00266 family protein [Treponemataceae bacterium]